MLTDLGSSYRRRVELTRVLAELQPSELALRDWVRPRMTAAIVLEISRLDHGEQVEENRLRIEELLVARHLPAELPWHPREVLELSSHDRCDSAAEHVARLFSSLVLVRADDTLQPAATMATLVESALELGSDATWEAVRYLAWCRLHEPGTWRDDPQARPFLTLGLLLTYLMAPVRHDADVVSRLAHACVAEVGAALADGQSPQAMLKETAGGQGWRTWRALASRCLVDSGLDGSETLRQWLGVT